MEWDARFGNFRRNIICMPSVWDIQFTYTILALYKYDCSTVKGSLAMNNSFTYRSCCPDDGKWEEGKGLQIFSASISTYLSTTSKAGFWWKCLGRWKENFWEVHWYVRA